jgi:hypothetical protein
MIDSQSFEVVPGGLALESVARAGGTIQAGVRLHAPKGWRLLDLGLASNQPVPVRNQQVTLVLRDGAGATLSTAQVTADGNGVAQVPDNAAARSVLITDRFGNQATASIP